MRCVALAKNWRGLLHRWTLYRPPGPPSPSEPPKIIFPLM